MAELTLINLRRTIRCIMAKGNGQKKSDGSHLGFEATLWAAADKLRGNHRNVGGAIRGIGEVGKIYPAKP